MFLFNLKIIVVPCPSVKDSCGKLFSKSESTKLILTKIILCFYRTVKQYNETLVIHTNKQYSQIHRIFFQICGVADCDYICRLFTDRTPYPQRMGPFGHTSAIKSPTQKSLRLQRTPGDTREILSHTLVNILLVKISSSSTCPSVPGVLYIYMAQ